MNLFKANRLDGEPNDKAVSVRPLSADDSMAYRALRARVLKVGDGKYFSDSYVREQSFTSGKDWQDWCTETDDHSIIGLFCGKSLIGIMGILRYGKPEDCTVELGDTWIDPTFRKFGVAKVGYDKAFEWAKAHHYKNAMVLIRDDNARSIKIRQKQGFVFSHSRGNETWADGSVTNVHCFTLELESLSERTKYAKVTRELAHISEFLQNNALEDKTNPVIKLQKLNIA